MKLLCVLAVVFVVAFAQDEPACPDFDTIDWSEWSESCPWLPLDDLRTTFYETCGLEVPETFNQPPLPAAIANDLPDEVCGHCSGKIRCKNANLADNLKGKCWPIKVEKQDHCDSDDHNEPCDMPKNPFGTCLWRVPMEMVHQCVKVRPDLPEKLRDGLIESYRRKFMSFNCKESGDRCSCCCHPYEPSADGESCVEAQPDVDCPEFPAWNEDEHEWSDCLWMPFEDMWRGIKSHCQIKYEAKKELADKMKLPEGMQVPARCGYCSFRVKCRKRESAASCFPLEVEKKSCGNEDDCEDCAEPCEVPKIADSCDYRRAMITMLAPVRQHAHDKPYHVREGMFEVFRNMPMPECVEHGDQCMCCCHPYKPNEDRTACVPQDYCKPPSFLGWTGE